MMNILLLGIILSFQGAIADDLPSCYNLLDMDIFLHDCCQYPVIEKKPEVYDVCLRNCSKYDFCCFQKCSAIESGTYIETEKKINTTRLKEIFALQDSKGKYQNLTGEWRKVLFDSVETCNAPNYANTKICEFVYERMSCVFKENFINCPSFSNENKCKIAKTELEKCGKESGSWRFITDAFNKVKSELNDEKNNETVSRR